MADTLTYWASVAPTSPCWSRQFNDIYPTHGVIQASPLPVATFQRRPCLDHSSVHVKQTLSLIYSQCVFCFSMSFLILDISYRRISLHCFPCCWGKIPDKEKGRGLERCSVLKRAYCFCRGPRINSQNPRGSWSRTPCDSRFRAPSSGLQGHLQACGTHKQTCTLDK